MTILSRCIPSACLLQTLGGMMAVLTDHHGHLATAHLKPGVCMQNMQPGRQRPCPPRLSFPSPQGHHHIMGALPNEWFDSSLQYLGLEQSQPNTVLHENWLIQVLTHEGLRCHAPLFCGAITSCDQIFCYNASLTQQMGHSDHSPRS